MLERGTVLSTVRNIIAPDASHVRAVHLARDTERARAQREAQGEKKTPFHDRPE